MFSTKIYLHSNMVRFIIHRSLFPFLLLLIIYIPIWLDLLSTGQKQDFSALKNLHSNMVRFIIISPTPSPCLF